MKSKDGIPAYMIVRTDSLQFETNKETGHIDVHKIRWTGPCEYELRFSYESTIDTVFALDKTVREIMRSVKPAARDSIRNIPQRVRIVATGVNFYVFKIGAEGSDLVISDTIWFQPENLDQ